MDSHPLAPSRQHLATTLAGAGYAASLAGPFADYLSGGGAAAFTALAGVMAGGLMAEAVQQLNAAHKTPDPARAGFQQVLDIAHRGAGKPNALRGAWRTLLANCMDKDFPHEIRQEDITLFDTLNPSDVLVMMAVGLYSKEMNRAFRERIGEHRINGGATKDLYNLGYCLKDILRQGQAALGNVISVSEDEIRWSILARGGRVNSSEKLFEVPLYVESNLIRSLTNLSMCEQPQGIAAELVADVFRVSLLPHPSRLVRILGAESQVN